MFPQTDIALLIDVLRGRTNDWFAAVRAAVNIIEWAKSQFGPVLVGADYAEDISDEYVANALIGLSPTPEDGKVASIPPWLVAILIQLAKRYIDRLGNAS